MRKRKELPDWRWPSWRYGPGGQAAIFQKEEDVPEGWTKKPDEAPEVYVPRPAPPVLDRAELLSLLAAINVEVDPTWGVAHMKKVLDDRNSAG